MQAKRAKPVGFFLGIDLYIPLFFFKNGNTKLFI